MLEEESSEETVFFQKTTLKEMASASLEDYSRLKKQAYIENDYIIINVEYEYRVQLNQCDTLEKILDWCLHLNQKSWMAPGLLERFVSLACEANNVSFQRELT